MAVIQAVKVWRCPFHDVNNFQCNKEFVSFTNLLVHCLGTHHAVRSKAEVEIKVYNLELINV